MTTVQDIAIKALELVASAPDQSMIGARLGALLKLSYPTFSPLQYQSKNLRQFIRTYVPGLTESSHTGFDVVFVPTSNSQVAPIENVAEPVNVSRSNNYVRLPVDLMTWRVYSNPSNPQLVFFDTTTAEITTVDRGVSVSPSAVQIDKPSSEFHLQMAIEFIESQPQEIQVQFERVLKSPRWYQQFSALAKRLNIGSAWAASRITKLSAELEGQLLKLGTPLNAVKTARLSHARIAPVTKPTEVGPSSDEQLRALVSRLILNLSIEELRAMRFSLGSVLDAMMSK